MADIRETVAEQARKWEALNRLIQDEEIYKFLQERFSANGHIRTQPLNLETIRPLNVAASAPDYVAGSPEPTAKPHKKGEFTAAVAAACLEMQSPAFGAWEIFAKLRDSGFRFNSADPVVAVGQVMRKLAEQGTAIKVFRVGSGRRPTRYQRLPG